MREKGREAKGFEGKREVERERRVGRGGGEKDMGGRRREERFRGGEEEVGKEEEGKR